MLTESVLNGSREYDISQKTIDVEIAALVKKLEYIEGFNPRVSFDPEKHLLHKDSDFEKTRVLTLTDFGIKRTHVETISDVAEKIKKYGKLPRLVRGKTTTDLQICGYIANAPFTYTAWTHRRTQEIINNFADFELKIMIDYEIVHINASLIDSTKEVGSVDPDKDKMKSIYDWHYDSNPFVIVLMLSTNDSMQGGKTGLRKGNEEIVFIDDLKVGHASILQGRVVRHVATKPISNHERISSVVGYIPEWVEAPDRTVLTSFKPSVLPRSLHDEYYPEWINYRLNRIEDTLANKRNKIMDAMKEGKRFDQGEFIEFCKKIEPYLLQTLNEFEAVCDDEYPPKLFSLPYSEL